jgi:hypothetical protein
MRNLRATLRILTLKLRIRVRMAAPAERRMYV